jgi:MFS superfamily sulfate permease-like transporter
MRIVQATLTFLADSPGMWRADWLWGLPLIVLTVVIHVLGLGLMNQRAVRVSSNMMERRHPTVVFVLVMGVTTMLATSLRAMEAGIWAAAYQLLGALRDNKSAMLYSLGAITSYGHANLLLEDHWQLMGAMEALNGWLLFGLTTAFLFGMIEKIWLLSTRGGHR